ncbi:protein YdfC, partial [Escherichia coli]
YTDDELYEWMRQKIMAAQDLKWANEARTKQAENLSALEQDIASLTKAAALSVARMITYPR